MVTISPPDEKWIRICCAVIADGKPRTFTVRRRSLEPFAEWEFYDLELTPGKALRIVQAESKEDARTEKMLRDARDSAARLPKFTLR